MGIVYDPFVNRAMLIFSGLMLEAAFVDKTHHNNKVRQYLLHSDSGIEISFYMTLAAILTDV